MKKILRLTESELVNLIKKSLNEQTWSDKIKSKAKEIGGLARKKFLETVWCSVKFGEITAEVRDWKGKQWCGTGGFDETYNVTPDESNYLWDKCPNVLSTPEIQDKKEGWQEIYDYFDTGKDGSKRLSEVRQEMCHEYNYYFEALTNKGKKLYIYSGGDLYWEKYWGKWSWDGTKPFFKLPIKKKATGYAQEESDITDGQKILNNGSRGELVKRVQFEVLKDSKGKINSGCKKGSNGSFKASDCDGIFGPKTKEAVKWYQKQNNLSDKTGIVGSETWGFMSPDSDLSIEVSFE